MAIFGRGRLYKEADNLPVLKEVISSSGKELPTVER
jgi:hypothetical protein